MAMAALSVIIATTRAPLAWSRCFYIGRACSWAATVLQISVATQLQISAAVGAP